MEAARLNLGRQALGAPEGPYIMLLGVKDVVELCRIVDLHVVPELAESASLAVPTSSCTEMVWTSVMPYSSVAVSTRFFSITRSAAP